MQRDVSVLVVAHAPLASALKSVAEHVFDGKVTLTAIDVLPGACAADSTEGLVQRILALNHGAGVLIMTDLPGASPANICTQACERVRQQGVPCETVTGVNASMVLRTLNYRHDDVNQMAEQALAGASQSLLRVE
jgi:PTS system ascorbate-specific IIA component